MQINSAVYANGYKYQELITNLCWSKENNKQYFLKLHNLFEGDTNINISCEEKKHTQNFWRNIEDMNICNETSAFLTCTKIEETSIGWNLILLQRSGSH